MASIFKKIISGEITSFKIHEDDKYLALLDINHTALVHTLCITKTEVYDIFDLEYIQVNSRAHQSF